MPDGSTTNYHFVKPIKTSFMWDVTSYLNNNWDLIEGVVTPDIITGALPQAGGYNVGDRIFRTDDNSIYILIVKDATWGWFWRPVHAAISPWRNVPASAIALAGWNQAIVATNPFAIAFDNRGNCHWRGFLGLNSGNMAANTSVVPLNPLPTGMLPRESTVMQLGYQAIGAAVNEIEGVTMFISGVSGASAFRVQGLFATTCQISQVCFDGKVRYAVGTDQYFGA